MFCKNCGKENDSNAKFCAFCGCNLGEEVKEEATIEEETKENTETNVTQETEKTVSESNNELDKVKEEATNAEEQKEDTENLVVEEIEKTASESNSELDKVKEKASEIGNEIKEKISSVDVDELKEKASEIGSELKEKVSNIDVDEVKDQAKNFAENEVKNYKNFKNLSLKQKLIRIAIPVIVLIIIISILIPNGPSDEDYIADAKTAVSKMLKSPATAMYSNEKIVEKDDYGRVLVTLTVDAQNSFGAYVRENYAVVIESHDTSTDKFVYYPNGIEHWREDYLEEVCIEGAKMAANWNEPLEDD